MLTREYICVSLCVCVRTIPKCMGARVHRCTCMCVGTHVKARSWCLVSSSIVLYLLNSVSHLNPELKDPANLASNLVLRIPYQLPHSLAFALMAGDLKSGPHSLMAGSPATEPPHQPPFPQWQVFCPSRGCFSAIHRAVHWHKNLKSLESKVLFLELWFN